MRAAITSPVNEPSLRISTRSLAWQLPRDYLLNHGESTPAARGSGYVAALRELNPPGWNIEAGYQWTIADLTGRTATTSHNLP